jgi:hypothetical protein
MRLANKEYKLVGLCLFILTKITTIEIIFTIGFTMGLARTGADILHHRFKRRWRVVEPTTSGENCFQCGWWMI